MLLFSLIFSQVLANVPRIESRIQDIGNSSKIFLKFGLISVVEFPQNIIEVRIGNPNVLKAVISNSSPKELTLYFKTSSTLPTNLIVKSDKKIYVLDVIPSKSNHQDFVRITGGIGSYNTNRNLELIESVMIKPKIKNKQSNQILIEKVKL